jgi:hypothetical protein
MLFLQNNIGQNTRCVKIQRIKNLHIHMLFVIQCIIISIVIVVAIHYGMHYLKDTFSVTKIKYESAEIEKYKRVLQEISDPGGGGGGGGGAAPDMLQIAERPHVPSITTDTPLFFSESAKTEIKNDLDKFLAETTEEQYIDALTQNNTQNNINISFETI